MINTADSEYMTFLDRFDATLGDSGITVFSVVEYPDKPAISFEILLCNPEEKSKFAPRVEIKDWSEFVSKRKSELSLYFTGLFKQSMIEGKISMANIMRDAHPAYESLCNSFLRSPDSKYIGDKLFPVGLHFGTLTPVQTNDTALTFFLLDFNQDYCISGYYSIRDSGESPVKDSWGRLSKVLHLRRY